MCNAHTYDIQLVSEGSLLYRETVVARHEEEAVEIAKSHAGVLYSKGSVESWGAYAYCQSCPQVPFTATAECQWDDADTDDYNDFLDAYTR